MIWERWCYFLPCSRFLAARFCHSARPNVIWKPTSLLDDPRILQVAEDKYKNELKKDRETAIAWNSPKYAKAGDSRLPQLSAECGSGLVPSRKARTVAKISLLTMSDEDVIKRNPNEVVSNWQRLWTLTRGPPSTLKQILEFAVSTDFSELTPRSIAFLSVVLSSCSPQLECAVFFRRVYTHFVESSRQYSGDEIASVMWSLEKMNLADLRVVKVMEKALHGKGSHLSWTNACQIALIFRNRGANFPTLHTDLYERYLRESQSMTACDLLCFAMVYRMGLAGKEASESDTLARVLSQVSTRSSKCSVRELLAMFSLFSYRDQRLSSSQVPAVVLTCIEKQVTKLKLHEVCSIFDTLRAIRGLKAHGFVSKALQMYQADLVDLMTSDLVQTCMTAVLQECFTLAPLTYLFVRSAGELRAYIRASTANCHDLWKLHLFAATDDRVCLPPSVARYCQVRALKDADELYHKIKMTTIPKDLTAALVDGYNSVRCHGRKAITGDVATNLILPTGHLLAGAMLFDDQFRPVSWDTYKFSRMPWLSQDMKQVSDDLSWQTLDKRAREYRKEVPLRGHFPYGVLMVEKEAFIEQTLDAKILKACGWRIWMLSIEDWKAAVAGKDINRFVGAHYFSIIAKMHERNQHLPRNRRAAVDALEAWQKSQKTVPSLHCPW